MQQKKYSSVGSGAQARNRRKFSWKDKYVCLQQENQRLKHQFRKTCEAFSSRSWTVLKAKAERDRYREHLLEPSQVWEEEL